MLTRSRILVYWLLLLVPTLLLGVWGWRLLVREEERLVQAGEMARLERLSLTAENIDLFLEEVKAAVVEGLLGLPRNDPEAAMFAWRNDNPFIRQVFIWRPSEALVYPDPANPGSEAERHFVRRFSDLLGQRGSWPREGTSFRWRSDAFSPEEEPAAALPLSPRREVQQLAREERLAALERGMERPETRSERGRVGVQTFGDRDVPAEPSREADVAESAPFDDRGREAAPPGLMMEHRIAAADTAEAEGRVVADRGWIPWHWEDTWSMLGWIERHPGGEIRGAELEMDAVFGRMATILADAAVAGEVLALLNGEGEPFSIVGSDALPDRAPAHVVPVSVMLPDWRVAVYPLPGGPSEGGGFLLISLFLLGTFLVAILSGGSLLLWQAHRNALDARRKSGFVSNVSHELKTPLTTLRMYAELLGDPRGTDEPKRRRYLDVIQSETERLTRLVNNVLDFSRLERGRKTYRSERFDAAALVADVVERLRPRLREAGMKVDFRDPGGDLMVETDRDGLEQVCLNLMDNAVKYAAGGGELTVRAEREDGVVCIRFMDRGPGIPPAHRERIFDEFHRVDDSLTAENPGCGLGLNIARQLLRAQRGELGYAARDGGGSVFSVILPLSES